MRIVFFIGLLIGIAACASREMRIPERQVPLTPGSLAGTWIMRRSEMVKSGPPYTREHFASNPARANIQVFGPDLSYSSPTDRTAGSYTIAGDTILIRKRDGDSTLWTGVRLSRRWLRVATDHGAHDFDGDGKVEWANATFIYERQQ